MERHSALVLVALLAGLVCTLTACGRGPSASSLPSPTRTGASAAAVVARPCTARQLPALVLLPLRSRKTIRGLSYRPDCSAPCDLSDVRHWTLVPPERLAAAGFVDAHCVIYFTDDFLSESGRAGRSLLVTVLLFTTPQGAERALKVFTASRAELWETWRPLAPVGGVSGIAQTGRLGTDNLPDEYPSTSFVMQVGNACLIVGSQGGSQSGRPLPERFLRSLSQRVWREAQHLLAVSDPQSSPSAEGAVGAVGVVPGAMDTAQAARALRATTTYGDGVFARYFMWGRETNPLGVRVVLVPGDEGDAPMYRVQWNDWSGRGWSRGKDVADVATVFARILTRHDEYQLWRHRGAWWARGVNSGLVADPEPGADGLRGTWMTWDQAVASLRRARIGEGVWYPVEVNGNQIRTIRVPAYRIGVRYLGQVLRQGEHSWRNMWLGRNARIDLFFQGGPLYKLWTSTNGSDSNAAADGRIVDPARAGG